MSEIIITDQNFNEQVLEAKLPILVDFWAPWCGPCRVVGPIIAQIATEYAGKLLFGKLNVDENQKSAGEQEIMSIPSLLFFKNGKVVKTITGSQSKEVIIKGIEEIL